MLEEAEAESDPENRGRLLTFVVAGEGFLGIECLTTTVSYCGGPSRQPGLGPRCVNGLGETGTVA